MKLELLNIRTPAVQSFLWTYLEPSDFRHDYTKLDALKEVERQVYADECQLWGDLDANFMFRAVTRNPKVLEPHIMGDGMVFRSAISQGLPIVWSMGYEKVAIWTQFEQIARIVQKCGFTLDARLPRMHADAEGNLLDLFVLTMEKPNAL
jgi:hypothetical protein